MNILPHKSWHVWNKDNIAKVRRDEREHAEKQAKQLRQQQMADQERRLSLLRARVGVGDSPATSDSNSPGCANRGSLRSSASRRSPRQEQDESDPSPLTHVNLFAELEVEQSAGGSAAQKQNPERVREQTDREQRQERRQTMYLGQSSAELLEKKPWYLTTGDGSSPSCASLLSTRANADVGHLKEPQAQPPTPTPAELRAERRRLNAQRHLAAVDPLVVVNRYLGRQPLLPDSLPLSSSSSSSSAPSQPSSATFQHLESTTIIPSSSSSSLSRTSSKSTSSRRKRKHATHTSTKHSTGDRSRRSRSPGRSRRHSTRSRSPDKPRPRRRRHTHRSRRSRSQPHSSDEEAYCDGIHRAQDRRHKRKRKHRRDRPLDSASSSDEQSNQSRDRASQLLVERAKQRQRWAEMDAMNRECLLRENAERLRAKRLLATRGL